MRREFKVNSTKVAIVNRNTNGLEINSYNPKYDVMYFDTSHKAWTKLCSCMTLAEGKELAVDELS